MFHTAYIALGSNEEPELHLETALAQLAQHCTLRALSAIYRTPAIGRPEQAHYLNGVVKIETELTPRALKFDLLRRIEADLGRKRSADKFAARPIDLDILLYDDLSVEEPDLVLPDPDLAQRPFLVAALLDCCPEATLPDGTLLRGCFAPASLKALEAAQAFGVHLKQRFFP